MKKPIEEFYRPPAELETEGTQVNTFSFLLYYWNALLAWIALGFHCLVFAAFAFIDDGGATGKELFPLAPLAILLDALCIVILLVQVVILFISFARQSSSRYHRLLAIAITWVAILLMFVAGRYGWFIHV